MRRFFLCERPSCRARESDRLVMLFAAVHESHSGPFQPHRLYAFASAIGDLASAPAVLSAKQLMTTADIALPAISITSLARRAASAAHRLRGLLFFRCGSGCFRVMLFAGLGTNLARTARRRLKTTLTVLGEIVHCLDLFPYAFPLA